MTGTQPVEDGDPILPNLLTPRPGATVDLALDYVDIDGADAYFLTSRLHGQYLMPQGLGGYIVVPFAHLGGDDVDGESKIGNIEVGGLFHTQQAAAYDVLLRGGVSIDTQGEPDSLDEVILNVAGHAIPRPTDAFTLGGLNTTWARAQAQVTPSSNNIVFGGMIGFDVPVAGDVADADELTMLINAVGAVGYHDAKYGAALGLTLVQSVSDDDDDNAQSIFLQGNMAINPTTRIYGGFGLPLDELVLDGTAFMFGVRAGM